MCPISEMQNWINLGRFRHSFTSRSHWLRCYTITGASITSSYLNKYIDMTCELYTDIHCTHMISWILVCSIDIQLLTFAGWAEVVFLARTLEWSRRVLTMTSVLAGICSAAVIHFKQKANVLLREHVNIQQNQSYNDAPLPQLCEIAWLLYSAPRQVHPLFISITFLRFGISCVHCVTPTSAFTTVVVVRTLTRVGVIEFATVGAVLTWVKSARVKVCNETPKTVNHRAWRNRIVYFNMK